MKEKKTSVCISCGNAFEGRYCNQCGEKKVDKRERTLIYFLGQLVNALTFTDTKFINTLKYLFIWPGFLALEYVRGKRNVYTKPIALFFVGNLIYFLFLPVDTFNSSLKMQMTVQPYSSQVVRIVNKKVESGQWDMQALEKKYDRKSTDISKLLLIVMVFLFSIPLSILYYSRKQYYFNHLIFSLNFITFIIYGIFILLPLLYILVYYVLEKGFGSEFYIDMNSPGATFTLLFILFVYLVFGLRTFYKQNYGLTFVKAFLLTVSCVFVILGYKFFLFYITIHAI